MESKLRQLRARAARDPHPRRWIQLGWTEFLHGHRERARAALRRARHDARRGADRAYTHLNSLLVEARLPGRSGLREALPPLWQNVLPELDHEETLHGLANYLAWLKADGCPTDLRAELLEKLVHRALRERSGLVPRLELDLAWCRMEAGRLWSAREIARRLAGRRRIQSGVRGRARVLARVLTARLGDDDLLEGISLLGQDPLEALSSRLLLAGTHLRLGRHEQAEILLVEVDRSLRSQAEPAARADLELLLAELAVLRRDGVGAARRLDRVRQTFGLRDPAAWQADLLEARRSWNQGDAVRARRLLSRTRPRLERLGRARPIREAQLLALRLDLSREALGDAELRRRWDEARQWEDLGDRLRWLALVLLADPGPALRRRLATDLSGEARGPDPRARLLHALYRARGELARSRPRAARRHLEEIEFPPRSDLPERTLLRWSRELSEACRGQDREFLVAPKTPDLSLDLESRMVRCRGKLLDFTRRETMLRLLGLLLRREGEFVPVPELVEEVWGRRHVPYETDNLVQTGVHRLRKLLGHRDLIHVRDGAYGLLPGGRYELTGSMPKTGT